MLFVIISCLLPVFGIMLAGCFAALRGLLPANAVHCLNQYVYWIALPSLFFSQLALMETGQLCAGLFLGLYAGLLAAYLPCFFLLRIVKREDAARATIAACMATFPNVMFMGLPIVSFLLPGDASAPLIVSLAALLYLPDMLYTDTLLEMLGHRGKKRAEILRSLGRSITHNPSLVAPALGLLINLCGLTPPAFLTAMTSMLGGTAAPCALFAMGMALHAELARTRSFPKGCFIRQLPLQLTKLCLMPLFTFMALSLFGISGIPLGVATLCSGMPSAVAVNVLAERHQAAARDTALGICLNTAASMISLSGIIALLFTLKVF